MMEIVVRNLCKSFGDQAVLRDLSFTAGPGITAVMAPSGSVFTNRATFTAAKSRSPSSSETLVPARTASSSSPVSSRSFARAPWTSGQSKPALAAFFWIFSARHRPGRLRATASTLSAARSWCFSFRLSSSQFTSTSSLPETAASPKTWGWR